MIGDKSGCVQVIDDSPDVNNELFVYLNELASAEWNKFNNVLSYSDLEYFSSRYRLSNKEQILYANKQKMPISFINKYVSYACLDPQKFLWHKKQPCTLPYLIEAINQKKVIKVKCSICGRILFADYASFSCIKWRSCCDAECLKTTIQNTNPQYQNLYAIVNHNPHQILSQELQASKQLIPELTYYSNEPSINIAYISDIHLECHLEHFSSLDTLINKTSRDLFLSLKNQPVNIILFGGDIADSPDIEMRFYKRFMQRFDMISFKNFRRKLRYMQSINNFIHDKNPSIKQNIQNKIISLKNRIKRAQNYLLLLSFSFPPNFNETLFRKYQKQYYPTSGTIDAFTRFTNTKTYKSMRLSTEEEDLILNIFDKKMQIESRLNIYMQQLDDYEYYETESYKQALQSKLDEFSSRYSKPIEKINLTDYIHYYPNYVFAVLGNHEFSSFATIDSCVNYYDTALSAINIHLLHNTMIKLSNCLIYGGTGFAKYNPAYNADNLRCCLNFTRDLEKIETDKFEKAYQTSLCVAKENSLVFICISHYPVADCLHNHWDKSAIYFSGHNHKNEFVKSEDHVLYADNQIGYKYKELAFKIASTGTYINPYINLKDGLYETTVDDYLSFYRYIGKRIGDGTLLYQRCSKPYTGIYVIKSEGFYGFFIVCTNPKSPRISIVRGGQTKILTNDADIKWICDNFDVVINKYLQILLPLRKTQEHISSILKKLGLNGNIHGTIVDIDFFHHIAVNPSDGTLIMYYSPSFGMVQELYSFDQLFTSIKQNSGYLTETDYEKLLVQAKQLGVIGSSHNSQLQIPSSEPAQDFLHPINCSEGMYSVSRKIHSIQQLFEHRILRDFDLRLIEKGQFITLL